MFRGLSLLAATELGGTVSRNIRAMPYFAFGALIFLFGFGFLLDLAHTWLSLRAGPLAASGILAGVLLAVAGGLLLVGQAVKQRRQSATGPFATSALLAAPFAARIIGGRLSLGTLAVAGVVAAGAVLGRYIGRS